MAHLTSRMHEIQEDKYNDIPGDSCVMRTFLIHWRAPLYDSLEPLQRAYVTAMESGAVEVAFLAVSTWIQLATCSGHPLDQLERNASEYCGHMDEFKHKSHMYMSLPFLQFCLNMMGQSEDPMVLTGEAMDEKTYHQQAAHEEVLLAPQTCNVLQIMLACHFNPSPHVLKRLVSEHESVKKPPVGHFLKYTTKFYVGLSYIELYRSFAKRSDKRKAHKIANELRKWTLDGCPNTKPLWALINAELTTLSSKRSTACIQASFLDAIQEASKIHNLCLEAMANERAARYQLTLRLGKDQEPAGQLHMERAIQLYRRYGAFAKTEILERTTNPLISSKPKPIPKLVTKECLAA